MSNDLNVKPDTEFEHETRLPYAGTSGRGGSAASAEAKAHEDKDGVTGARQSQVISLLRNAGPIGMTWNEISARTGWHHGQATGALSTLHKSGDVARLALGKRARSSIYILPEFAEGRVLADFGGKPAPDAPVPSRPALTAEESIFLNTFIDRVKTWPQDKPVFPIRTKSAKELVEIVKKLAG